MNEIEERAIESRRFHKDESFKKFNEDLTLRMDDWAYGYCQGATEQKEIDDAHLAEVEKSWIENSESLNIHLAFNMGKIQCKREMIDKAWKVIDDLMMAYISGKLGHDEVMEQCRIRLEE